MVVSATVPGEDRQRENGVFVIAQMYVRDTAAVMHATSVLFYALKEARMRKAKSAPVSAWQLPPAPRIVKGPFQHMSKCSGGNHSIKRQ